VGSPLCYDESDVKDGEGDLILKATGIYYLI
jgi:hypothetical protein